MPKKILVADDDKNMLGLYSRIFSRTGYDVSSAGTFAQAAEMIRAGDFDLLITDLMFPDGLGTELIRLFGETRDDARTLLVTGSYYGKEKLERAGAHCFIEKPFNVEEFMAVVEKALA